MDQKKRAILVAAIGLMIIAGVISSFGLPLFIETSSIILPTIDGNTPSNGSGGEVKPGETGNYTVIKVTNETVQDVIATLHRKEQYYRQLSIERFWGPNAVTQGSTSTVLIWNDGAYSKTAVMSADGSLQNCLLADGVLYVWYGSDKSWFESDVKDSKVDFVQNIPTYEDVLALSSDEIVRSGYENKSGVNCIFVERLVKDLGYLERYWISTESGLLFASETLKEDGVLIYRMKEETMTKLTSDGTEFTLPDGRVLHRVVVLSHTKE